MSEICDLCSVLSALAVDFHVFIFNIYMYIHYYWVYVELTIDHLCMWLGSSADRGLHLYYKVMGLNPVQA